MEPLIKLRPGLYIKPTQVASIAAYGPVMINDKEVDKPRVVLVPITGNALTWEFSTTKAAQDFADTLADAVNGLTEKTDDA